MQVSAFKLKDIDFEVMVVVGTDSINEPKCKQKTLKHGLNYCGTQGCEGSELLYDLKAKYLDTFDYFKDVQPTSFKKACEGEQIILHLPLILLFEVHHINFRNHY